MRVQCLKEDVNQDACVNSVAELMASLNKLINDYKATSL